jgi:hypothetical protein
MRDSRDPSFPRGRYSIRTGGSALWFQHLKLHPCHNAERLRHAAKAKRLWTQFFSELQPVRNCL